MRFSMQRGASGYVAFPAYMVVAQGAAQPQTL